MDYSGSFTAGYNPNLQTSSSFSITPLATEQLGGFNAEDLLNKLLRFKSKAANQAAALGVAPKSMGPAPLSRLQQFDQARQYMDRLESPLDRYTMGNSPLGSNFRNMPAASAVAFGQDVFPSGFDVYSDIMRSSGGVDPNAESKRRLLEAQTKYYGGSLR